MAEVTIIQRLLPHYRIDFFDGLRTELLGRGINLRLIYGSPNRAESKKNDIVDLGWATKIHNRELRAGLTALYWQPALPYIRNSRLVIVEQANKNVLNYWLMISRGWKQRKIAFWGHGRNLQTNPSHPVNRLKRLYIQSCDWWFAYTHSVKDYLIGEGYPADRITVVQNAIDTRSLQEAYAQDHSEQLNALRNALGLDSANVGIYCGALYKQKRIPFLIEACDEVRRDIPDFHLLIIGDGPDNRLVRSMAETRPWVHYVGPKFGNDRVPYFKLAKILLIPGLVGLAVLDAFALQTPLITTQYPYHSPEIEYLEDHVNGLITEDDPGSYAHGVVRALSDPSLLSVLVKGCKIAAGHYSLEQMIRNYADGITACLQS
jgi:glycosyltransferase involved in cell wall biosynthesis